MRARESILNIHLRSCRRSSMRRRKKRSRLFTEGGKKEHFQRGARTGGNLGREVKESVPGKRGEGYARKRTVAPALEGKVLERAR